MDSSLRKAVESLTSEIPEAFAYVFDAQTSKFFFKSRSDESLEKEIFSLNQDAGLDKAVAESEKKYLSIQCQNTGRQFLIKKIAAGIFLGLCVDPSEESIFKAEMVMNKGLSAKT